MPAQKTVKTVKTLEECDKTKVYRCVEVTMAWINGAWCRLDTHPQVRWTPITFEPTPFEGVGFYELGSMEELNYSDYRNHRSVATVNVGGKGRE